MDDPDAIANVFGFLPLKNRLIAEGCCQLWRHVSRSDRLVLSKFDSDGIKKIPEGQDEQILGMCRHGVKLLLVKNTHIPPALLEKIAEQSPDLEELELLVSYRQTTTESLIKIFEKCPKLKKLTLHRASHLIQHDLLLRLTDCKQLQHLDLSYNSALSSRILSVIATLPLRSLNLQMCEDITNEGILHIAENCASSLTYLNLTGCVVITDESCVPLGAACRNLKELHLDACTALTNSSVVAFAQPNLTHIYLNGCYWLTSRGLNSIASACPDLHTIDLTRCSLLKDNAVVNLVESCTKIRSISIERVRKLTDLSVAAMAMHLKDLRTLRLAAVRDLTPSATRALLQFEHLIRLDVRDISSDDAALAALQKKFPNLELQQ